MRRLVVVLCLCAWLCTGCASTGAFSGRLVSQTTGLPIAGASVSVGSLKTVTDANGEFLVDHLPLGANETTISPVGFRPYGTSLVIEGSDASTTTLKLPDAALHLVVAELSVAPEDVKEAILTVGEATAAPGPDGSFTMMGLPTGEVTVTVGAPDHESTSCVLTLTAGDNAVQTSLSLTARSTYQRYYEAYSFGRYKTAYKYLHKDVRQKEPYRRFVSDMKAGGTSISLKLGKERILKKWRSGFTKKTYRSVTELDRTYVSQWLGRNYVDKMSQHWVRVGGMWFMVWTF